MKLLVWKNNSIFVVSVIDLCPGLGDRAYVHLRDLLDQHGK